MHIGVFILPNTYLENKYIRRNIFIVQILNISVSNIWINVIYQGKTKGIKKNEAWTVLLLSEQDPGPISSLFLRMRLPNSFIDVLRAIMMVLFWCPSNFLPTSHLQNSTFQEFHDSLPNTIVLLRRKIFTSFLFGSVTGACELNWQTMTIKRFICLYTRANQRNTWLVKGLKFKAHIPSSAGERKRGEMASMRRTNHFL